MQVKQNFERFISCKNTIDSIYLRLRKSEKDDGEGANGAGAVVVTRAVEEVRLLHYICPTPSHWIVNETRLYLSDFDYINIFLQFRPTQGAGPMERVRN